MKSACFVPESQLKHEPDGEHDGDGKQAVRGPCDELCVIHNVLQSVV